MRKLSPLGPVYQAGTLSGNPIATAAGLATLRELRKAGVYRSLERKSKLLFEGLTRKVHESGIGVTTSRVGSMMTVFFAASDVSDYENALRCDTARFARFHAGMLARGVYLAPSQFEAVFVSTAHTDADIRSTVAAAGEVFAEMTELS
jgi:glutamate-1-semialdehyde 2,1-aminomutase